MICERCGYDFTEIERLQPRYCIRCGEKLEMKKEVIKQSYLSIDDVCDLLQLTKASVYQYVHKNKLPFFKVGGKLRFDKEKLEELRR